MPPSEHENIEIWSAGAEEGAELTLFDAFPEPVLLGFAEAGHALGAAPADEVCLFELAHERLLACFRIGGEEELLGWWGSEMEGEAERHEERWRDIGTSGQGDGVVVVYEADGPMPVFEAM